MLAKYRCWQCVSILFQVALLSFSRVNHLQNKSFVCLCKTDELIETFFLRTRLIEFLGYEVGTVHKYNLNKYLIKPEPFVYYRTSTVL